MTDESREPRAQDPRKDVQPSPPPAPQRDPNADLQAERDDLMSRLQRVSADYVNYQKRTAREFDQAREYANEQILKSLLAVLDDMERALAAARENHADDDPLLVGMQLVHDKLLGTLKQYGLEPMDAEGQAFDPDRHQALMRQPTAEAEPMTVLQVAQKGYLLKGRTLRPAAVIVATAPESDDERGSTVDVKS